MAVVRRARKAGRRSSFVVLGRSLVGGRGVFFDEWDWMSQKIRNFKDLEVWRLGKTIVVETYQVTKLFPNEEMFGLVAQMRRAAVSIPSNISEGFCRNHKKEFKQFLYLALGSCGELETQVEISFEIKHLSKKQRDDLIEMIDHEAKMLRNLIKKII